MTFKELYLSGQVPFEEIDRYISRWNRSDDERTLAKYLGLNACLLYTSDAADEL